MENPQKRFALKSEKWLSKAIKYIFAGLLYGRLIFALMALGLPGQAHAGMLSLFTDLFAPIKKTDEQATIVTSQNIALLQAAINPNPNPAKGGGDINVVGDSALLPENGPSGTIVDIEESHSDQISLYVVRDGDTLGQIAKMFGVSVNTIAWANNVTSKTLKPGDTLVILPISGVRYEVKKGDTLKSIASKFKADATEILQFNNLKDEAGLTQGLALIIPDGEIAVSQVSSAGRPTSKLHGAGGPNYDYYYTKPLAVYVKTQGLHGYNGVDLGAPVGTPIMASAGGEVIISKNYGWNGGYGEYVVISHQNGTQTLYSHMSNNITYAGMHVNQGQVIGFVGATGKATGPHLHFEVRGAKNPF